eukprot:g1681.t1
MKSRLESIRTRSVSVINLTGIFEKADEAILPAMYNYISKDYHASPSEMGAITVCRGLTQALTSPIGGILGNLMNRVLVILIGCLIWATMTWLFGVSRWAPHPFVMGGIVWTINGLGLSLVVPSSQSIIADYYTSESRGRAFGLLYLTGQLGAVLGSLFATNVAGVNIGDLHGWQIVMFILAVISAVIGFVNYKIAKDPRGAELKEELSKDNEEEQQFLKNLGGDSASHGVKSWNEIFDAIKRVFKIRTFQIIILQGVVGSMPWKALASFTTLYLQLIGMSNLQASFLYSTFLIGAAIGGWIGGIVGDRASLYSPNHGRILACQFSVFSGIPLTAFIFHGLPKDASMSSMGSYAFFFSVTGLLISWAAPCCNNPIFAEIIDPDFRNIIYSFDRCLEDALASPVSFLVGAAAEQIWGFKGDASASEDHDKDLERANALANALLWFSIIPWSLCLVVYTGLHFTYARDRRLKFDEQFDNRNYE